MGLGMRLASCALTTTQLQAPVFFLCTGISDLQSHRQKIVKEIFDTEHSYISQLNTIVSVSLARPFHTWFEPRVSHYTLDTHYTLDAFYLAEYACNTAEEYVS